MRGAERLRIVPILCSLPPELYLGAALSEHSEVEEFIEALQQTLAQAHDFPHQIESEIVTRQGELRLISWNNTLSRDGEGRVIGLTARVGTETQVLVTAPAVVLATGGLGVQARIEGHTVTAGKPGARLFGLSPSRPGSHL